MDQTSYQKDLCSLGIAAVPSRGHVVRLRVEDHLGHDVVKEFIVCRTIWDMHLLIDGAQQVTIEVYDPTETASYRI